ncbi:MAG: formylglycine-generating enzyme family protein [Burkholderiales bacterium]|nr:formylglycine-generating enzyme family protein [Burkholderiales bacterium]
MRPVNRFLPFSSLALTIACVVTATVAQAYDGPSQKPTTPPAVIENSIGMKLVLVPAGSYMMGTDESVESLQQAYPDYEPKRLADLFDERPRHKVQITQPFYIGKYLVTVGQFAKFVAESGYVPESIRDETGGYGYNPDYDPSKTERKDAFEGRNPKYSWKNPGFAQGDDHPVLNVSWNDAVALADWLSKKEHAHYRLPTEAEWEYACRGGKTTRYPNSDDPESLSRFANTFDADAAVNWPGFAKFALKGHDGYAFASPVGSFPANGFGLYDMVGNAWEWTNDWYDENYYAQSPDKDPQGPKDGNVKVRRGGSWHTWSLYARCAFRNWNTPSTRYTLVGMRLVRDAEVSNPY